MAQRSWNILNDTFLFHKPISSDSQQLPLCVSYPSHSIACAAIYLSAMYLRVSLSISRTLEIPLPALNWWELFDTSLETIQQITREMFKLYERKRIEWLDEAEQGKEPSVCHIETIENSVLVSPNTDWTNYSAGITGNSGKRETWREEKEEEEGGEEGRRERRREREERNESINEKSNRERHRHHRHRSRSPSESRSRSRSHSYSKSHSHSRRHSHRQHHHHFSFC